MENQNYKCGRSGEPGPIDHSHTLSRERTPEDQSGDTHQAHPVQIFPTLLHPSRGTKKQEPTIEFHNDHEGIKREQKR